MLLDMVGATEKVTFAGREIKDEYAAKDHARARKVEEHAPVPLQVKESELANWLDDTFRTEAGVVVFKSDFPSFNDGEPCMHSTVLLDNDEALDWFAIYHESEDENESGWRNKGGKAFFRGLPVLELVESPCPEGSVYVFEELFFAAFGSNNYVIIGKDFVEVVEGDDY